MASSVLRKKIHKYPKMSWAGPNQTTTLFIPSRLEIINISGYRLTCSRVHRKTLFNGAHSIHTLNISYSEGSYCFNRKVFFGLENTRVCDISGNSYSEGLASQYFSSFPNLTHLVARDTPLTTAFRNDEKVFEELKQLQYLDIRNSGLTYLPSKLLINQPNLRTLDLSYNKLTSIPDLVYSLSSLKDLDLRYNAITDMSNHHREALDIFVRKHGGIKLWLEGNPLNCICSTFEFVEWIWASNITFDKHGNYSCVLGNGKVVPLLSLKYTIKDRKIACVSSFWVKFGSVGSSLVLFMLIVSVVVYRYRVPIKYWYHGLRGRNDTQTQRRYKYDALVALDAFGHGYKLCVYDRDFLPGVPIDDSIMAAINRSYKIIMVISPAFVRSVWCRYELQLARMKMVQEGREDVVIPIILEDVPVSSMPKSLLNLWNTSVFLIWSESPGEQRHFWANLTAALGPVLVGENEGGGDRVVNPCGNERCVGVNNDGEMYDDDDHILLL